MASKESVWPRTTAPTITTDSSVGAFVGLIWLNTVTRQAYVCYSAAVGAAVWGAMAGGLFGFATTQYPYDTVVTLNMTTSSGTLV